MAVPKRKTSKSRRDKRRSSVWKLQMPTLVRCNHCSAYTVLHKVCKECGYYRGKQVVINKTPATNKR
ncbi:MAG: 50S ribosomal protein L32 [Oscillospiraceae bacterium]|jgi:large subunit ribosomal protein L32|nr:50S ribosomal protein L32 [Oscillospiraceae bacterium]